MISKEQWEEIGKALKGSMGVVKFKLGEKEIALENVLSKRTYWRFAFLSMVN
ncbi:hypothetical protein [Marinomonas sp. THO17]|uniref:hypothetical protein n=1 Tax=Marinomonas sp. THO17 TaxID=3149048 RepID=UPI00336BFC95